jgi:hypothetical protein
MDRVREENALPRLRRTIRLANRAIVSGPTKATHCESGVCVTVEHGHDDVDNPDLERWTHGPPSNVLEIQRNREGFLWAHSCGRSPGIEDVEG